MKDRATPLPELIGAVRQKLDLPANSLTPGNEQPKTCYNCNGAGAKVGEVKPCSVCRGDGQIVVTESRI